MLSLIPQPISLFTFSPPSGLIFSSSVLEIGNAIRKLSKREINFPTLFSWKTFLPQAGV
jgi:hypothetical protein